ncbi:MAG TPA: AAA family ATPase [Bacillota bacterium]
MPNKKIGLTLGKYAPFHQGHQYVIETALQEMDEVIVIIYDAPDVTHIPLNVRAGWIRKLYPQVRVIEAWNGPTEVGASAAIKEQHERYIIDTLGITNVTAFYSSEFYGEHMSRALHAENRLVDPERKIIPVSATQIRQQPYLYRKYLNPVVYRDLIVNVVFLGAPSSGKTTLAKRMAEEFQTVWMPEYGREYWEQHQKNRRLSAKQLLIIAQTHLELEERLLYQADRFLFTDTNSLTTAIFAQYYHGRVDTELAALASQASSRYDLVFLCDIDIPYDDTWDRSGETNRTEFQKRIIADLALRKIPYFVLSGTLERRVQSVKKIISQYQKFINPIAHVISLYNSCFREESDGRRA